MCIWLKSRELLQKSLVWFQMGQPQQTFHPGLSRNHTAEHKFPCPHFSYPPLTTRPDLKFWQKPGLSVHSTWLCVFNGISLGCLIFWLWGLCLGLFFFSLSWVHWGVSLREQITGQPDLPENEDRCESSIGSLLHLITVPGPQESECPLHPDKEASRPSPALLTVARLDCKGITMRIKNEVLPKGVGRPLQVSAVCAEAEHWGMFVCLSAIFLLVLVWERGALVRIVW